MGLFSKSPGRKCALCGKKLSEPKSDESPLFGLAYKGIAQQVEQIGLFLQTPGYICEKCNAVVCNGCRPVRESPRWKNFPQCPKCGSDMKDVG